MKLEAACTQFMLYGKTERSYAPETLWKMRAVYTSWIQPDSGSVQLLEPEIAQAAAGVGDAHMPVTLPSAARSNLTGPRAEASRRHVRRRRETRLSRAHPLRFTLRP
jgi:hypothetical protein